ncbi:MAG: hybrid sensor histidine kinase/response regulator [Burkholderiales bacterium]|nr:hybrid sensor histidine kinase/response regulator [Burkholderiales bacterium]
MIIQPIIPATVALDGFQSGISLKPIGLVAIQLNLKPTNRFKRSTLTYTICASLLFLALSGYLVHLASRRLTHPVKMLSDAVQAISQGKLDTRVSELEHVVEFNVLSHGINYMSERLRQDRSELQKQVDRATLNIRESMQKAEQANLEKSKFLAAASHDLRQPIHALGLFLGALSRTGLTETQKKLLENSCAASEATMKMLDTLLDFSRIEAGVVEPQWKTFRLQAILNKIENDLAPQADAKGIVYRTRETQLAVRSDPALVELILRNLVSNAIRYTEQGGLLVGCRKHGNQVVLEVWDTGIGIAKDQQEEVFREFHQLGNPERDRRKGLGLGLAIALGLARVLGHDLSLSSASGRGSVFRIALPKAILEMTPASPESPRIHVLSARVLVIDDDVTVLEGMRQLLCGWGCECDIAETIEDAIRLAGLNAPDMVISDYRLRGLRSGIQAIESLRHLLGEGLPALLITGDTAPERLREAQTSGLPLLHKPVMPAGLYYSIAKAIEVS